MEFTQNVTFAKRIFCYKENDDESLTGKKLCQLDPPSKYFSIFIK